MGGPGFKPAKLQYFYKDNINQLRRDTWRPIIGPRVLFSFVPKQHVSKPHWTEINQPQRAISSSCHVSSTVRPSTWPYGLYGQVQSTPLFDLFDLAIKSRYLLHTDSICENKYTAKIRKTRRTQWHCFRLDPSTLKIEQILIP